MVQRNNRQLIFRFFLLFSLIMAIQTVYAQQGDRYTIKEIVIEGNSQIEKDTIRFALSSRLGDPVSINNIRRDIKALYKLGFFDDVAFNYKEIEGGVRLILTVKERPIIREVLLAGNKRVTTNTLTDELTIKPGERYDPVKVKETINKIRAKYIEQGFNYAAVVPRLTSEEGDSAALILDIDEGTKVWINEINFIGNQDISSGNRFWGLKSKMKKIREKWFFSWITTGGKLSDDSLEEAVQNVEEYYKNKGYLKATVGPASVTVSEPILKGLRKKPKRYASISIPVYEGDVYKLGEIKAEVADETIIPSDVVSQLLKSVRLENYQKIVGRSVFFKAGPRFQSGKTYSYALEQEAIKQLSELYGMRGYIYVNINPAKTVHDDTKIVDITFKIIEGDQAFLHRLEFTGNIRTRDRVLRRNVMVPEGAIFNTSKIKQSIGRIQYLGYIDDVVPDIKPLTDPSQVDVNIQLSDNKQTEIQLAGGYSDYDRFYGTLGLSEHNLFGRGQSITFSTTYGKRRESFNISFTDEWIFDRPYYGSVGIWNTIRDYDYSKQRSRGGSITAGRSLGYNFSVRTGYKWELNTVYDINDEADQEVKDIVGDQITSSLTSALIRDTLDNRMDPSTGIYSSLHFEYAGGFLSGDNNFYKIGLDFSMFRPLFKGIVFGLYGDLNFAEALGGDDLPFYERFLLGGPRTVRGYDSQSIGPWDEYGQNLGGNKSLRFSAELQIPIAGPLKTVLFADAGDAYATHESIDVRSLRPSAGVEIRFFVPAFSIPLRFIWGYNLDPLEGESLNDFQFTMGTFM